MKKVVCILGATAVGKTRVALSISKNFNGAIISADSVQIYKKLDIISGKDVAPNSKFAPLNQQDEHSDLNVGYYLVNGTPIYMLDLIEPTRRFSISEYKNAVNICLNDIFDQEKLPIFVGGSGLYINSILNPMNTLNIQPDYDLRNKLEGKSVEDIQEEIRNLDADFYSSLNNSERNNKRRLIRKIEILKNKNSEKIEPPNLSYMILGLDLTKEENEKQVKARISHRINNGALSEARELYKDYNNLSEQVKGAIGYKDLFDYLKGEVGYEEAIKNWEKSEVKLIKKQKTWFKKDKRIKWLDANRDDLLEDVKQEINAFLTA